MDINIGQINYKLFNKSINELLTEIGSDLYNTQLENNNGISYEKFMESFCSMEKIKKYSFPFKERLVAAYILILITIIHLS